VNNPKAITASANAGSFENIGNIFGITKYQRKICTNTGIFLKISVQIFPIKTKYLFCVVLKTPIKKPRVKAIMNANKEIVKVVSHAVINQLK
jgi:hypothetical protein